MTNDYFDEDPLASGHWVDGLAALSSTLVASFLPVLGKPILDDPILGAIGGAFVGAIVYLTFYYKRNKDRINKLKDDEKRRIQMFGEYSVVLKEGHESSLAQEWKKIKLQIASSALYEFNQKILQLELALEHNIPEHPELIDVIVKLTEKFALSQTGVVDEGEKLVNPQFIENETEVLSRPLLRNYAILAEDMVAEMLRAEPDIVEIRQQYLFAKYMADFVVIDKKNQTYIVEVKVSKDGKYPHMLEKIGTMISGSSFRLSNKQLRTKFIPMEGGYECRIFVAKIIPL